MPPRPAGTDGRDHSYREVIADRYRRMADYKNSIEKLMALHFVFVLVKLGWHFGANQLEGVAMPLPTFSLLAGEILLLIVYKAAKLGNVKESLGTLKIFNIVQVLLTATQVLSGWAYHNGTHTGGVPNYEYATVYSSYIANNYPAYGAEKVVDTVKAFEMFLDLTLAAFLIMATFISHKMIVEKMEMKKDKKNVKTYKDAQKGGSDDSDSENGDEAPAAVPLQDDKPKVVKAASRQESRRRHA